MKKKILGFIIFLLILNFKVFSENNIFLIYKIENEIITNIDIVNESKYLLALSTELKNLDNKKISKIAEGSIIRETVKKIELLKYFDLEKEREIINKYVKNFYLKLNIDNLEQFKKYLESYDLSISDVMLPEPDPATYPGTWGLYFPLGLILSENDTILDETILPSTLAPPVVMV